MTNQTEKLITKIFWFSLPFIITFFTWITITIFNTSTTIEVVKQQGVEREKIQEKIWTILQENNQILQSKADEEENKKDHNLILGKIINMENKLDRNYVKNNTTYNHKLDSSFVIPFKSTNMLVRSTNN